MKTFRKLILPLLLALVFSLQAQEAAPRISLVTADPGPEVFELYGHQAVRVQMPDGTDLVYNFGLFDFNAPNFVYRFVKGETDYMSGAFPTRFFLADYEARGSRVTEQELNLRPSEAWKMVTLLEESVRPENSTYRYRYCTNNCATRILDIMEASLESKPQYPAVEDGEAQTYRETMRRYDVNYPWYGLGVDIALGSDVDRPITSRERMFVPVELRKTASATTLADGRRLVREERPLVEGRGDVTERATPLLLAPRFWAWALLLGSLIVVYRAMRRGWRRWRWWASLWFAMTGFAGCLSMFLIFISVHEATSPNILGWWLNPLWLVVATTVWMPRARNFTKSLLTMLSVMTGAMLLAWNFGAQNVNTALMLLCINTLVLSVSYILTGKRNHEPKRYP